MASAIIDIADDPDGRRRSVASAADVVESLAWDRVKGDYLALVNSLAGGPSGGAVTDSA